MASKGPISSKIALITGGASGMGLAVARHLLAKGWHVCLCDLNPPPSNASDVEKALADGHAMFMVADVTNYESLAAVFVAAWAEWGRLDFVYANAGISEASGFFQRLEKSPVAGTAPPPPDLKTLNVNTTGVMNTVYLATHYMRQNETRGGKIVATASSAGIYASPLIPVYAASKHAVVGFVRSIGPMLKDDNISINCLCPGLVPTGLTEPLMDMTPQQFITPLDRIVSAVDDFLEDNGTGWGAKTGCAAELSAERTQIRKQPDWMDDSQRGMMEHLARSIMQLTKKMFSEPK